MAAVELRFAPGHVLSFTTLSSLHLRLGRAGKKEDQVRPKSCLPARKKLQPILLTLTNRVPRRRRPAAFPERRAATSRVGVRAQSRGARGRRRRGRGRDKISTRRGIARFQII